MKTLNSLLTILMLVAIWTPGMSAARQAPSRIIQYTQAELATTAGVARVHKRLSAAAREVCQNYSSQRRLLQRCSRAALAASINDIQNPALSAYHARQHGTLVVASAGRDAGYQALVN
jgi:UrcA family protein